MGVSDALGIGMERWGWAKNDEEGIGATSMTYINIRMTLRLISLSLIAGTGAGAASMV